MTPTASERFDFFLSRRGSVATIAQEVADVLVEKGHKVIVQDYDIPLGASFIDAMHEAVKNARDLVILFTQDYEASRYTRREFTSFEAERAQSAEERRIVVLRCQDVPLRGLLADLVYQDLVGINDAEERKQRIIAAVEGRAQGERPPPRPFVGVPPRVANFTGREDALDRLDAILVREKPATVTQALGLAAVQGLGGVGKTSLAVEYAHRYRSLYAGVWWCPAESRAGLLSSLAGLAVMLGAASAEEADVEKAAREALRRLAEQRATWLLVYDNVESPEEIADLLPGAGARVLITSRFSDWSGWADEVSLDMLPTQEAVSFLLNRSSSSDEAGARALAEALGCLPLALDHAAATCRRMQLGFADYAARALKLTASVPRGAAYPRSVAATFDLAIQEAVTRCAAAEDLMAFLAQCAPERIPMMLIEGAVEDEVERLQALAALAEVSLLKHDPFEDGPAAVTVHRLVQVVARVRSAATGTSDGAIQKLISRLLAIYSANESDRNVCDRLTPHVLAVRHVSHGACSQVAEWPELLTRAGRHLCGKLSTFADAEPLFRDALAIHEKVLGPEHLYTAASLNDLVYVLRCQGDLANARPLCERALAICEKALSPEHSNTVVSLNNLADLLRCQGDLAGARPLYERALAIREKTLGPEHPDTAHSRNVLAALLEKQGALAEARPLFERALAIHQGTCSLHEDALAFREKGPILGFRHLGGVRDLVRLATLAREQGDLASARSLYERVLAFNEVAYGPEDSRTAVSIDNLAGIIEEQGDYVGARSLYERALALREKTLGPATVESLNKLAVLSKRQGRFAEARTLYERALDVQEKTCGRNHPDTARSLNSLGMLLYDQGNFTEARPLLERGLAIREHTCGPCHPDTALSLNSLAALMMDQGDLEAARPLFERVLAIYEDTLGPEDSCTARTLNNLGTLFQQQENLRGALPLLERALAIYEKARGLKHPDLVTTLYNLAHCYQDLGDFVEARLRFERALAICDKEFGHEHPLAQRCRTGIASALKGQSDLDAVRLQDQWPRQAQRSLLSRIGTLLKRVNQPSE